MVANGNKVKLWPGYFKIYDLGLIADELAAYPRGSLKLEDCNKWGKDHSFYFQRSSRTSQSGKHQLLPNMETRKQIIYEFYVLYFSVS